MDGTKKYIEWGDSGPGRQIPHIMICDFELQIFQEYITSSKHRNQESKKRRWGTNEKGNGIHAGCKWVKWEWGFTGEGLKEVSTEWEGEEKKTTL